MQQNSPVPKNPEPLAYRSVEVAKAYLHRGGTVTRSIWVHVSPRHLWLKVLTAPLFIVVTLATFLLIVMILVFVLLAVALFWTLSRLRHGKSKG